MAAKEEDSMHWADQIAREVKARVESNEVLQKVVKDKGYIVYDEKTPSGKIHIGAGRGWIIHDAIAKAMRDLGLKARFILSSDDIDPFDAMNVDLPKEYEKYLGMPFRSIPSPVKGCKSFADYYFQQCVEKFEDYGIDAEIESTGDRYIKGDFNKTIKTALDHATHINEIYHRFYGKAPEKLPFNPICEKCGRIGTTVATHWDPEKEMVTYHCSPHHVTWAKGCSHEGKISPYNGNGKFPWKIEWAAKWPTVGVVCEFAGKDHFSKGGSRSVAVAVCDEVFKFPVPYPSTPQNTGDGYEFFTIGGRKMSTSKGHGIGFAESVDYAPAKILRFLLIATRPRAVIDFDPINKNDLILLYERFDRTERVYYGIEKLENPHDLQKHKRIYELSHIGAIPKKMAKQIPFTHASMVMQVTGFNMEKAVELLKKTDYLKAGPTKEEIDYAKERLAFSEKWLKSFAPNQYKFSLMERVSEGIKLNDKEKEALMKVAEALEKKEWNDAELHNEFYDICKSIGIETNDFFKAGYKVLINKEKGPRLANFILTIGKEKVGKLFRSV